MNRPKLIDVNVLEKVLKKNSISKEKDFVTNIFTFLTKNFVYLIVNYYDFILVLIFLFFILFFRYKYNSNLKIFYRKPDDIQINYIRNNDIVDNKIVNTNDKMESSHTLNDDLLKIVKQQINQADDNNLKPMNLDNYQSFSSY